MSLNDLDLPALTSLGEALAALAAAGRVLDSHKFSPRFDLTPGEQAVITVSFAMPGLDPMVDDTAPGWLKRPVPGDGPFQIIDVPDVYRPNTCSTEAASGPADAVAAHTQPAPVEPPPADLSGPTVGDDPLPSAEQTDRASVSNLQSLGSDVGAAHCDVPAAPGPVVAESGGGQVLAVPDSPPAPMPGSASALAVSHLAGNFASPPWTAEEDARLITLVVRGCTGLGLSRRQAIFAAAAELERPFQGAEFRCRSKLKDRLDAAIEEAIDQATQSPVSTAATAHQDADPAGGDAAVGGHTPAAVQSDDPLTTHLRGMTDKGGWSLARDLELMELSCEGWRTNEIALQLTMQANAIQPRFDALTGLHTDDATGKKQRRWTREEVLGGLLVLSGKAAA